eukprot:6195389-Pleurochrysis_carterae.AAC.3
MPCRCVPSPSDLTWGVAAAIAASCSTPLSSSRRPIHDASNHGDLTHENTASTPSASSVRRFASRSACQSGK